MAWSTRCAAIAPAGLVSWRGGSSLVAFCPHIRPANAGFCMFGGSGAAPDEAFSADRRGAFDSNDDRVYVVEVCEVAVTCDER
jgi:hypothetical protein